MTRKEHNILAVNPGTKYLGLAVFQGTDLVYYAIKVLKGEWSREKMRRVERILSDLIDRHDITMLTVKRLHPSRSSRNLHYLTAAIERLAKKQRLKLRFYTLDDLRIPGTRSARQQIGHGWPGSGPVPISNSLLGRGMETQASVFHPDVRGDSRRASRLRRCPSLIVARISGLIEENIVEIIAALWYKSHGMDTLTPEQRSKRMALVKAKGSKLEMFVRRYIYSLGYRYRLHASDLPGKPDMVFKVERRPSLPTAVFGTGMKTVA